MGGRSSAYRVRHLRLIPAAISRTRIDYRLMTAAVLAPVAAGDPSHYAVLAAVLALLVGAMSFVGALARLGFLSNLLSRPVLVGYMTGIAIVMIVSQFDKITGAPVSGDRFIDLIRTLARNGSHVHWPTLIVAAAVLVLMMALARWAPKLPGPLIALLAASVVVYDLALGAIGIDVIGEIPAGLPAFDIPRVAPSETAALILPALGIAIVAFSDNVLTGRAFAAHSGAEIDANAELRALAVANVTTGLTHGFPVSSSGSRTALAHAVGGRTQLYSLIVLALVVAVMLWGQGVLANFATAALGALVVYAALRLIDVAEHRRLARFRRSEWRWQRRRRYLASVFCTACWQRSPCRYWSCCAALRMLTIVSLASFQDSPGCIMLRTIHSRRRSRAWSSTVTTHHCASRTRRTSAVGHWMPSSRIMNRRNGSS